MRTNLGTIKLMKASQLDLKAKYKEIYGVDIGKEKGIPFGIFGNINIFNGSVVNPIWLNEKECFELDKVIQECLSKFKIEDTTNGNI